MEHLDAFAEHVAEIVGEEGGADADALLGGAHGVERTYGDAVVHQLTGEFKVIHTRILHGEVETVGEGSAHVVVIHEIEAVGEQDILHELRTSAVLAHVVEEVVCAVAGSLHECRHGMLYAVCSTAGEGVHQTVGKEIAIFPDTEFLLQCGEYTMVELVADAAHAYALSRIRESLGT